eukprot:6545832-Heterocapsa_arctica.AAC.1
MFHTSCVERAITAHIVAIAQRNGEEEARRAPTAGAPATSWRPGRSCRRWPSTRRAAAMTTPTSARRTT